MLKNDIRELDVFKGKWFVYFVALRGMGKTSLMAHLACMMMIPPYSIENLRKIRKEVDDMRKHKWDNLSIEDHVRHAIYVIDDVFTSKGMGYEPRRSMTLEFKKLGLYDGTKKVEYLLPFSKLCIPELQSKVDSRKSTSADAPADSLLRFLELQRKHGVQMFADTQIHDSSDKRFRGMADCVVTPIDFNYTRTKTTWKCLIFENIHAYERWFTSGKTSEAKKQTFVHIGNIFDCMDSRAGKERFYGGMEENQNYHTEIAPELSNDKSEMMARCEKHIKKPDEEDASGKNKKNGRNDTRGVA